MSQIERPSYDELAASLSRAVARLAELEEELDKAKYPFGASLDEMDVPAFFNMRDWLKKSVEAQGAKMVGGGIGLGQADIDIVLDGCRYNISIKPLPSTT